MSSKNPNIWKQETKLVTLYHLLLRSPVSRETKRNWAVQVPPMDKFSQIWPITRINLFPLADSSHTQMKRRPILEKKQKLRQFIDGLTGLNRNLSAVFN